MRDEVEFNAEDGTKLRAFLHRPTRQPAPIIVMSHGFSGVREQIDSYAAAFCNGGFFALNFDHRGFGASEGLPRQEIDPARQMADWRDAISFASALPGVSGSIGVWGSSFSGGLAMVLSAGDRRIKCVVAQIPNVGGRANGRAMFDVAARGRLARMFEQDRAVRLSGGEPMRMPVLTADPNAISALPPAISANYIAASQAASPTWVNEVTLRSVENMLDFEPSGWIEHIAPTPLMMIVATNDTCTFPEPQLASFAAAREPKRLVLHPGGHFDTYTTHFEQTSAAALNWFASHLSQAEKES